MSELVRGQIVDRPWGLTFGQLGLREITGQLTVHAADGRDYRVAFQQGAIVGATSPQAADAVTRIAMTSGLISSTQVGTIAKQIAATPEIDDIALLAAAARLLPEQIAKLRRRVIAQRAARTFSVETGSFIVDEDITIPIAPDAAVDVRAVVLQGARMNLSELRLISELRNLGSHFTLGETAFDHADWFGIGAQELPILEALRHGTTLPEIEAKHRDLDPRNVQSVIYALVSCRECTATAPATAPALPRAPSAGDVSVSFRRSGEHVIPTSLGVSVSRTQTTKGSTPAALTPPAPTAEEEFRTASGTRTGQPPTRRPHNDDSSPLPPARGATPSVAPPSADSSTKIPRTATEPPRAKPGTAPWPHKTRDKPPSTPPVTPRTISQSGAVTMSRTISQSGGMPGQVYSEGSDRITQSIDEAAEAFRKGIEALHGSQLPAAVEQLQRASTLNPHEFEYSAMLAYAQLLVAQPGDRPKLADKTRKMLTHLSQKSRDAAQVLVYLGQLERVFGNDKQAIVHFRAALTANPEQKQAAIEIQQIEDKALEKSGFGLFKKK